MIDVAIIEKEAMQLPDTQRALLAARLLESISSNIIHSRKAWTPLGFAESGQAG
jgi:hypothetical protein